MKQETKSVKRYRALVNCHVAVVDSAGKERQLRGETVAVVGNSGRLLIIELNNERYRLPADVLDRIRGEEEQDA